MPRSHSPRVVIVGAGMSGLCAAVRLKQAGVTNITILEKASDVGGTWLSNTYPNAGCDVPSFLYSFSFAPKHDWSEKFARQPEILEYFRDVAERFELRGHIQFETSVAKAEFDESQSTWTITTEAGDEYECEFFISAVGQLSRPHVPAFVDLDQFAGESWHSANWNHEYDLAGRDVAVIGNGASSVQFLPTVAQAAKSVTVYQRAPNWILPLKNYRYPAWATWAFRNLPLAAKAHRWGIFAIREWNFLPFAKNEGSASKAFRRKLTKLTKRQVPEEQHQELIPDYSPGCKRVLLSSDYYQTLNRENVHLVTGPIERFTKTGIVGSNGETKHDVVIFATGFKASEFLQPMTIIGRAGQQLDAAWSERPKTLYGILSAGFPNMFLLYGPNTNLGHNSIISMVECQVGYIIACIKKLLGLNANEIEVTESAIAEYEATLRKKLSQTVWAGDCVSWYKTDAGDITNNWWGTVSSYWLRTRKPDFGMFRVE